MTPYLFVLAFTCFVIALVGPILLALGYEQALRKIGFLSFLRNTKFFKLYEFISTCVPKIALRRACVLLGVMSILVSGSLMLIFGFDNHLTRDLSLFVGLWATTLFGIANFLKD